LFAFGDWTGGFAAYVSDGRPVVAVCLPGANIVLRGPRALPAGRHRIGLGMLPADGGTTISLVLDADEVAAEHTAIGLPLAWQHGGTSLTLGADRGLPLTSEYTPPYPWTGALHSVLLSAGRQLPPDQEDVRVALQVD
jgi:arylsulfatase